MKQTSNYQLNQWEQSDRILMEDFNADNAKVDGALAELSGRSCLTPLKEVTVTEEATTCTVQLEDIDWNQWQAVVFDIDMVAAGGDGTGYVGFSTNANLRVGTFFINSAESAAEDHRTPSRLILFCNGSERSTINSLAIYHDHTTFYNISYRFNYLTFLDFSHSDDKVFTVGSSIRMYGIR